MIVAINRVDKSCLPAGDIAVRKHLSPREWWPWTRHERILHIVGVRGFMMLLRALLLVIGALIFVSATAFAVGRSRTI
jgi:hypothetical protein